MGIGTITVPAAGAVTEPTRFPLTFVPAAALTGVHDALYTSVLLAGSRGLMLGNGFGFVFHIVRSAIMATGLIAPETAPTAVFAAPGAKASRALTTTGNFTNGDRFDLVSAGDQDNNSWPVVMVSAFATSGENLKYYQVLIGASASASIDNIVACINGTAGEGTTYQSPRLFNGEQTPDHPAAWSKWITATKTSAAIVTFTAVREGTPGNSYEAREVTDGGGTWSFPGTVLSGGLAGTGLYPKRGARSWGYLYKRSLDDAQSGVSPTVDLATDDQGNVTLGSLADPPTGLSESIDAKTWLRTPNNAADLYAGYDQAVAATGDTDDIDDDALVDRESYDPVLYRAYTEGGVPRYKILVPYKGFVLGMGHVGLKEYSVGTASVTNGSSSVTLSSAALIRRTREGQEFRVTTDAGTEADRYLIVWIDETNRVLHLNRPYLKPGDALGSTTNYAAVNYAVRDARDPFIFGHSEPGKPNLWPVKNEYRGISSKDARGVTAAVAAFGSIVAFTRTGIWTITGSYGALRVKNEYEGAGCVGVLAAWASSDGGLVRFVSDKGVYEWAGPGAEPQCISHGKTPEGAAWGIGDTIRRMNRSHAHGCIVHQHPTRKILRVAVPLDSDITNRYCLIYDLDSKVWTVDDVPDLTFIQTVNDDAGAAHVMAGDIQGNLWELDVSNVDGAFDFEPNQAATAGTADTATFSGTPLPTSGDGLKGVPCTLVRVAAGTFEQTTVASNTSSVVTFARFTTPLAAGDYVCFGAIPQILQSGKDTLGDPAKQKSMFMASVIFSPDVDGTFYAAFSADQDDPTVASAAIQGDLTQTSGRELFLPGVYGRSVQFMLVCLEPGCDPTFFDIERSIEQAAGVGG